MYDVKCIAPVGDICGEAATWSADENTVYWVDINRFLIHSLEIQNNSVKSLFFDEPVVALSLTDSPGKLLVTLASKLIILSFGTNHRKELNVFLPGAPEVRFNDGRTDPNGAFWAGSMFNNVGPNGEEKEVRPEMGSLFRYRSGEPLVEFETGIGISNTLCWSPDRTIFYFGDTLKNEIRAYPYDDLTGDIGAGIAHFSGFDRGLPDGSAIDCEGYLWNCRFGGSCVVRVAPNGKVDRVIEMPVKNITTCAFGGEDLSTLFITTASSQKAPSDRLAGSLFAIKTDTHGMVENRFKL